MTNSIPSNRALTLKPHCAIFQCLPPSTRSKPSWRPTAQVSSTCFWTLGTWNHRVAQASCFYHSVLSLEESTLFSVLAWTVHFFLSCVHYMTILHFVYTFLLYGHLGNLQFLTIAKRLWYDIKLFMNICMHLLRARLLGHSFIYVFALKDIIFQSGVANYIH